MLDQGMIKGDVVARVPGAEDFLAGRRYTPAEAENLTGVRKEDIHRAAELLRGAKRVVFVHGADRPQDGSPDDLQTLGNLVVLLGAAGIEADLLLPRIGSNSAALETMGADPAFAPGRVPSPTSLPGARTHSELRELLREGKIRAALIVGEDPIAWNETGSWFQNAEFVGAMDWAPTETTRYADVVLPGSTYLEQPGTRCNFEGNLVEFSGAVPPPSGVAGLDVLKGLARQFGIALPKDLTREVERVGRAGLGRLACFYINRGEERKSDRQGRLAKVEARPKPARLPPPLTAVEKYKREIREVGTERFRVR